MEFNRSPWNRTHFDRPAVSIPNALYLPMPLYPGSEKFPARIYNASFEMVAEIDEYLSLEWTRRLRVPGTVRMKLPLTAEGSDQVVLGYWMGIRRGGAMRLARIESKSISSDPSSLDDDVWEIYASGANGLLSTRIAYVGVSSGTGYDTVPPGVTKAETAIRHFVNGNCIAATDTDRNFPDLHLESDGAKGSLVEFSARLKYLTEDIESILLQSPNLGYEIIFDETTGYLNLHFWEGNDYTDSVVFSIDLGNIATYAYSQDNSMMRNYAYVGDSKFAEDRVFVGVPAASPPSGYSRRETFVDGSDCITTDELTQRGNETLVDLGESVSAQFSIFRDASITYMTREDAGDIDLGDIITAVYPQVAIVSARILEIKESYGIDGATDDVTVTIGNQRPDLIRYLKLNEKKNSVRRRA
jgi:hypothetical protein